MRRLKTLSIDKLITKMRDEKGITLNYSSEAEVKDYFLNKNNYIRTTAYRKNFPKHQDGVNKGKYINLDFNHLTELSTLDMKLRVIVMKMCIDVEHKLKISMLSDIENADVNEYEIAKKFLDNNPDVLINIEQSSSSPYTASLIHKYFEVLKLKDPQTNKNRNKIIKYDKCPIWGLLEVISFGDFIKCYSYYYKEINNKKCIPQNILHLIRSIRNCCAHNNCLMNNLYTKDVSSPPTQITKFVSDIKTIKDTQRKNKLRCRPILELVALLYVYDRLDVKENNPERYKELRELFSKDMIKNKDYFKKNELLETQYKFMVKVINHIKE